MRTSFRRIVATFAACLTLVCLTSCDWHKATSSSEDTGEAGGKGATSPLPFQVQNAANQAMNGMPAIMLSFTQSLDSGANYDTTIKVFEMPPRAKKAQDGQTSIDVDDDSMNAYEDKFANKTIQKMAEISQAPADLDVTGGKEVSGAWVVGENDHQMYFPHIKSTTRYIVQISADLPSKDGQTLGQGKAYSILSGSVGPVYYFASKGLVLPAGQNGGLPVVTVNVPEVDIQFLRVKADQLPRFFDQVTSGQAKPENKDLSAPDADAVDSDTEDQRPSQPLMLQGAVFSCDLDSLRTMADSVFQGRYVTEQQADKRSVTHIPVEEVKELQEPGIYIAIMSQPGRFDTEYQVTYYYVTDLGLQVHQFAHSADAFITSLKSGKALSGVDVAWLDKSGKTVTQVSTDSDGYAHLGEQPKNARVIMARRDQQVALLVLKEPALDLSEYSIGGAPYKPTRLFAYTGRDLYRPGESFNVSVLARDADGKPVAAQPIQATLKRPDGRQQLVAQWKPEANRPGYYLQKIDIPLDAPTGAWTLELRSDPADTLPGTVLRFNIEEFLPERMKLDLQTPESVRVDQNSLDIAVKGAYLYGAPAAGNRLLGVVQFERADNPLPAKFPGFSFGDINEAGKSEHQQLKEQTLDDSGETTVSVSLELARKHQSAFNVTTTLSLLESDGRPVIRNQTRIIWPAQYMVGIRPQFTGDFAKENSPADFEVIRTAQNGRLVGITNLPVRLIRENREWYWHYEPYNQVTGESSGWSSGYTENDELVETEALNLPASGRGHLRLPVSYGQYRVEIQDPQTQQTLVYRFDAGGSFQGDGDELTNRPDRVALKWDKSSYKSGDTAQLTITPPHAGEALITVEGDRVLWLKRVTISGDSETVNIPVDRNWARHDLYVNVSVVRPGNEGDMVTPTRALGLLALPLDRDSQRLNVSLEAPAKVKSETTVKIRVRVPQAAGQKALVTLSAVDVGILNITHYTSPDPFHFYFDQERYGGDIRDMYGRLIEKMAGEKGKLKFGGDAPPKATQSMPQKVRIVDLFSGPLTLDSKGEAEIPLKLPDFNGTLRLMAVVATDDHFGAKDAEMTVAAPIIAELSTPRFINFGDVATLALDLHNMSGATEQLHVTLSGDEGLHITQGERNVALQNQQKTTLTFGASSGDIPGLHRLHIQVNGLRNHFSRDYALQVEPTTPLQQQNTYFVVNAGQTLDLAAPTLGGFYPGTVTGHIILSGPAPIDVRAAIKGLLEYPYGCVEQTTSTAYPFVFVDEAAARQYGLHVYTQAERVKILDRVFAKLGGLQAPNGGFSLWGEANGYDYWLSAYVASFLQDARAEGFVVPDAMYNKVMDFLLREMQIGLSEQPPPLPHSKTTEAADYWQNAWRFDNHRFEALSYGAYVLARERKAPLGSLRQLYELRNNAHSNLSLVQLGIALQIMGDNTRANAAIDLGLNKIRDQHWWWWDYDYGSTLRDSALSYVLLQRQHIIRPRMGNLVVSVSEELHNDEYRSTQEQLALFLLGRQFAELGNTAWSGTLNQGGKTQALNGKTSYFNELSAADLKGPLSIQNNGKQPLYAVVSFSGNPSKAQPDDNRKIHLKRSYFSADGVPLVGNKQLKVGDTIIVHVTAYSDDSLGTTFIVDRVPAGLEIENMNLQQGSELDNEKVDGIDPAQAMSDEQIRHVEFRDDRFVAAVHLGRVDLFYRARVVTPGRFVMPPTSAEDMYRPAIHALLNDQTTLTIINEAARQHASKDDKAR